jgi:hypothetical protein
MIKYNIKDMNFYVDTETGELVIETIEVDTKIENHIAIELLEILRQKLYLHREQKESVIKRLFK